MILADEDIEQLAMSYARMIEPYNPKNLQPASYDCTLSNQFRVFKLHGTAAVDLADPGTFSDITQLVELEEPHEARPGEFEPFVLHPGEFVLGVTKERFRIPPDITGRIEGKSSLGRLGLLTHVTAGFFDPGFEGDATLEFVNLLRVPIKLHVGMPICQMSFTRLTKEAKKPYSGRYQGSDGVVASRFGG